MGTFGQPPWGSGVWGGPGGGPTPPPPDNIGIPGSPGTTPGQYNNPNPTSNTGATNNDIPTGSTSSVAGFIPDFLMIMQEACEQAGVDFREGYTIRSAKRTLDFLNMELANEGLNLWTLDVRTLVLVPGQYQYTLPPDTVDILTPSIRTTQFGHQNDILMARQDFASYAAVVNKLLLGKPSVIFVQRSDVPQIYLWPVPNSYTPYTLVTWILRRMQNTGYSTNIPDAPSRLVPCIVSHLAWKMALKKPNKDFTLITYLEKVYRDSLIMAKRADYDRSPIYFTPSEGYY